MTVSWADRVLLNLGVCLAYSGVLFWQTAVLWGDPGSTEQARASGVAAHPTLSFHWYIWATHVTLLLVAWFIDRFNRKELDTTRWLCILVVVSLGGWGGWVVNAFQHSFRS